MAAYEDLDDGLSGLGMDWAPLSGEWFASLSVKSSGSPLPDSSTKSTRRCQTKSHKQRRVSNLAVVAGARLDSEETWCAMRGPLLVEIWSRVSLVYIPGLFERIGRIVAKLRRLKD